MAGKGTINVDNATIKESTEGKAGFKNANNVPHGDVGSSDTTDTAMSNNDNIDGASPDNRDTSNVRGSTEGQVEDEDESHLSDRMYIAQLKNTIQDVCQSYLKLEDELEAREEDAQYDKDAILQQKMSLDEKEELLEDRDKLIAIKLQLLKDKDDETAKLKKEMNRLKIERDHLAQCNAELLQEVQKKKSLGSQVRHLSDALSKVEISKHEESQEAPGQKRRRMLPDKI
ncbi:hypothetical protein K505DRAFT_340877 [Melanomma pulvis-pyrius CBS 109.77]|uniref:Uncharacterized protein n=1 Tax=Melanomma pulvis-pyrius CBS 109.77 TaxID=1314802 RepID=A0A6A6X0M1_9PLEO|nr:hypothetical protein K505DRAFT_340877 [Melanomma pulvis-pyrius CBS 109.77]